MHDSQRAGTAPPQTETLATPDPQHGKCTKQQRRTIIVNIDLDRKPACLAMPGGGRTLSPRDMVCTSSGEMVKTLALSRSQSPLVVRSIQ